MLLVLKVRPDAFPNGSPMYTHVRLGKHLCNIWVKRILFSFGYAMRDALCPLQLLIKGG